MRYFITFKDGTTKRVSQKEGQAVAQAIIEGRGFMLKGAAYDRFSVSSAKPITTDNGFTREYVDQQSAAELRNPEEVLYIKSNPLLK